MQIDFVYFDLGNILVSFDPDRACQNVAKIADLSVDQARVFVYESGALDRYENGQLTSDQFAELVRRLAQRDEHQLPKERLLEAISDMFTPIESMVEVVEMARAQAGRVGVLSNTCSAHWNWVRRQPWRVSQIDYDVKILSFEVKAMKPDPKIYEAAEQAARVRPQRILFIDDKPENVQAALDRGWNAEHCVGGEQARDVISRLLGHSLSKH